MNIEWSLNEISAFLMLLFTCVSTGISILLWQLTRRTIALQTDNNYSINHQAIVDGHRELFLGILHRPQLLRKFADANAIDVDDWEISIVSAFFINHIFSHYLNFSNETVDESYLQGFIEDAKKVFSFPTVRNHWQLSRVGYSTQFQKFVEEKLLQPTAVATPAAAPPAPVEV